MELRSLKGFVMVAEELHFGRAAERLQMAQPQLSQQIKALEKELHVKLFERNTRSVTLTEAGEAFLDPARTVLIDAELAMRAATIGRAGIVGRIKVGYAGASSREALPTLARAVRVEQPGIELVLLGQIYGGAAVRKVLSGELDIGFARYPITNDGVSTHIYEYERLVVALPSDHRLANEASIDLRDLAEDRFVSFPGTLGSTIRDATVHLALQAGFVPRILQEAPDSYTILGLVAAGVGVTITASSVQHVNFPGLVYKEIRGRVPHLAAALVWRRDDNARDLQAVLNIVRHAMPQPLAVPDYIIN
ncbi:LysR family transcriptional regulator [Arthrobacter sp. HY1533]|uniref:LysR family transcriptional regulator n=1 Tax=Arthrobacter sp. HY1533 TaxID=2970919 RepID=UPI0022B9D938|nr:LysR family transcriptional regulator [Arthrobacter sp. HY1533]